MNKKFAYIHIHCITRVKSPIRDKNFLLEEDLFLPIEKIKTNISLQAYVILPFQKLKKMTDKYKGLSNKCKRLLNKVMYNKILQNQNL